MIKKDADFLKSMVNYYTDKNNLTGEQYNSLYRIRLELKKKICITDIITVKDVINRNKSKQCDTQTISSSKINVFITYYGDFEKGMIDVPIEKRIVEVDKLTDLNEKYKDVLISVKIVD